MIYVHPKLILPFLLLLALPYQGIAQDSLSFDLQFEVHRVYPPISITKEKLKTVQTVADLNPRYTASWVKEYQSVEIQTIHKGQVKKANSNNDVLTQEQKNNLQTADETAEIAVVVKYLPNNNLKHNDTKEISFTVATDPQTEAKYTGGQHQLTQYLKEKAINKIAPTTFKKHNITAIKFTIDEEGFVINTEVFESSKDEQVDKLLVETICNMPNWTPAKYASGTKVKQDFVLTAGDHNSCTINQLNIPRNDWFK